jgi:hypothetical protein
LERTCKEVVLAYLYGQRNCRKPSDGAFILTALALLTFRKLI